MAQNKKLFYEFDGSSLGAKYIHSNWLYFGNTAKRHQRRLDNLVVSLKQIIFQYLEEEVRFYHSCQEAYVQSVANNFSDSTMNKDKILEHFKKIYLGEINNKNTDFGQIEFIKKGLQADTQWSFTRNPKTVIKETGDNRKNFAAAEREIPVFVDAINEFLNFATQQSNLNFLGRSKKSSEKKAQESFKVLKSTRRIQTIKNKLEKIKNKALRVDGTEIKSKDIRELLGIIYEELNIHAVLGLLAEKSLEDIMAVSLKELTSNIENDPNFKNFGNIMKNFNVIDQGVGTFKVGEQDVIIGASQKFRKVEKFEAKYVNQDIFTSLGNFVNKINKGERKQVNALKDSQMFFEYLRKNIIALRAFSLDRESNSPFDVGRFIDQEKELAMLRNFLRFFNGWMVLDEQGEFSPFNPATEKKLESPLIFNAFLVLRQDVYWMIDFIDAILITMRAIGFKSEPNLDAYQSKAYFTSEASQTKPSVSSSKVADLWTSKKRRLSQLKQVSYKLLESDNLRYEEAPENVSTIIDQLWNGMSAKRTNRLLVDKVTYMLDPSKMFK